MPIYHIIYMRQCIKGPAVVVSCESSTILRRHDERGRRDEKEHEGEGKLSMQRDRQRLKGRKPQLGNAGKTSTE